MFDASPHGDYFDWQERDAEVARMNNRIERLFYKGGMMSAKLKGKSPKEAIPAKPQVVIFGPPGIGKTWALLDFPKSYYIDCEGGANLPNYTSRLEASGGLYLGREDGACDFDTVIEQVVTLATTEHDRRTLIIDSFSKLFDNAIQLQVSEMRREQKKVAFGAERKPVLEKTATLVRWLKELSISVIVVCHEQPKWLEGESVGVEPYTAKGMEYDLNLTLQIFRTGQTRRARVVKSRYEQFSEADTFNWCYEEFAKRFSRAGKAGA
jgi:hypothetical protein